ncbi:hypothetical protein [Rheinheimera sp. WS51]|uniref:hypothetical protein n=1 Tax=Rheinheimera sp. WS51 TaxID=3425886 RepID=UPI003D91192B
MMRFAIFLIAVTCSGNAVSQQSFTAEEQIFAELYASYISKEMFVEICSEFEGDENYKNLFIQWTDMHKSDIAKGKNILTHHYSSHGVKIDKVFKGKIDAEREYFNTANEHDKASVCKRLASSISSDGN